MFETCIVIQGPSLLVHRGRNLYGRIARESWSSPSRGPCRIQPSPASVDGDARPPRQGLPSSLGSPGEQKEIAVRIMYDERSCAPRFGPQGLNNVDARSLV